MENLVKLIESVKEAMESQFYSLSYRKSVYKDLEGIYDWFHEQGLEFSESTAQMMAEERFGKAYEINDLSRPDQSLIRTLRKLVSIQVTGCFGYRGLSKKAVLNFEGSIGTQIKLYEESCRAAGQKENTIAKKMTMLSSFNDYMSGRCKDLSMIEHDDILGFFKSKEWSESHLYWIATTIRGFLATAKENTGMPDREVDSLIPKTKYSRERKLPTTYKREELQRLLSVVDRNSAKGKRDYLTLALAITYGWRVGDIVGLKFSHIDWERNIISFPQEKTGETIESPLLPHIGNAIIDYIRNGRPDSDSGFVLVCHLSSVRGRPLTTANVNALISRCMEKANIEGWQEKMHGPHTLRHSLATNMLSDGTPLPIISNALGHESISTTEIYAKASSAKTTEAIVKAASNVIAPEKPVWVGNKGILEWLKGFSS